MTRRMNPGKYRLRRKGMVLVVALLIMAIMSIIGATAITTSRIDIQISNNTKFSRQSFYASDGGIEQSPKFVSPIVWEGIVPVVPGVVFSGDIYDELYGFPCPGGGLCGANDYVHFTQSGNPNAPQGPDISFTLTANAVVMDVDRDKAQAAAGSGVEFASGAEGHGVGSMGGVLIFYDIHSVSTGATGGGSYLDVYYRLVPGTAGGK